MKVDFEHNGTGNGELHKRVEMRETREEAIDREHFFYLHLP